MSPMENPFVHLINTPDEMEFCLVGKENVKPRSLFPPRRTSESFPLSINSFNDEAIKSNRSCNKAMFGVNDIIRTKQSLNKPHAGTTTSRGNSYIACAGH